MRSLFASAVLLATMASTASAQFTFTATDGPGVIPVAQNLVMSFNGCPNYGPSGISVTGGSCQLGSSSGNWAQPAGSFSGSNYYTTSGNYPSTVTIDFSQWLTNNATKVKSFSLFWGSIDSYQSLSLMSGSNPLYTIIGSAIGGSSVAAPANGNQTSAQTNRNVRVDIDAAYQAGFTALRFTSSQAAFEFDDIAIETVSASTVVPEPATVTLLASALAALGLFGARRKRNSTQA